MSHSMLLSYDPSDPLWQLHSILLATLLCRLPSLVFYVVVIGCLVISLVLDAHLRHSLKAGINHAKVDLRNKWNMVVGFVLGIGLQNLKGDLKAKAEEITHLCQQLEMMRLNGPCFSSSPDEPAPGSFRQLSWRHIEFHPLVQKLQRNNGEIRRKVAHLDQSTAVLVAEKCDLVAANAALTAANGDLTLANLGLTAKNNTLSAANSDLALANRRLITKYKRFAVAERPPQHPVQPSVASELSPESFRAMSSHLIELHPAVRLLQRNLGECRRKIHCLEQSVADLLRERSDLVLEKNNLVDANNSLITANDGLLADNKQLTSQNKDLAAKNEAAREEITLLTNVDLLCALHIVFEENTALTREKNALVNQKEALAAEKDARLAEKDALIAKLRTSEKGIFLELRRYIHKHDILLAAKRELNKKLQPRASTPTAYSPSNTPKAGRSRTSTVTPHAGREESKQCNAASQASSIRRGLEELRLDETRRKSALLSIAQKQPYTTHNSRSEISRTTVSKKPCPSVITVLNEDGSFSRVHVFNHDGADSAGP